MVAKSPQRDLWQSDLPQRSLVSGAAASPLKGTSEAKAKSPERELWPPSPLRGTFGNPGSLRGASGSRRVKSPDRDPWPPALLDETSGAPRSSRERFRRSVPCRGFEPPSHLRRSVWLKTFLFPPTAQVAFAGALPWRGISGREVLKNPARQRFPHAPCWRGGAGRRSVGRAITNVFHDA